MKRLFKNRPTGILFFITAFCFIYLQLNAQQSGTGLLFNASVFPSGKKASSGQAKPLTDVFPLFGKKMSGKTMSNRIALPFGVGVSGFYYGQRFASDTLRLTSVSPITGDTIYTRPNSLIQDTYASEIRFSVKPNVWILPFLNIYGILGYTTGNINPNLTAEGIIVKFPGLGDVPVDTTVEIKDDIHFAGPLYGGGVTFATGYRQFFLVVDYNLTVTYPHDLDAKLVYNSFMPKAGVRLKPAEKLLVEVWGGAFWFSNSQTMQGKITVSDFSENLAEIIGDEAVYYGTINPVHQWNLLLGGVVTLNNHHRLTVEAGFVHRKQLRLGYEFRF